MVVVGFTTYGRVTGAPPIDIVVALVTVAVMVADCPAVMVAGDTATLVSVGASTDNASSIDFSVVRSASAFCACVCSALKVAGSMACAGGASSVHSVPTAQASAAKKRFM